MWFVTKNVTLDGGRFTERSVKKGGYGSITSAERAAKRVGGCFIRDDKRNIVGQTINSELPLYVR